VALGGFASIAHAEPSFFEARVAPILQENCVQCHGEKKHKMGLRLDSFAALMRGSDDTVVINPGAAKASEIMRRIKLPATDEDVMPSDGKPLLSPEEIKIIELWIDAGASATSLTGEFPSAPPPKLPPAPVIPLAPDWRPRAKEIAALESALGMRLVPRSRVPTDGLVLRTASAPRRCDDAALARLAPVAALIVDAELARTRISDAGLKSLAACINLRSLDLTRTAVTSSGLGALASLQKLEVLNLTETAVDAGGVAPFKSMSSLRKIWLFGTPAEKAGAESPAARQVYLAPEGSR